MFWRLFIFRCLSTREPVSGLTMNRETYFILRAHTGTTANRKNSVGALEKMQVNGPEEQKLAGRNPWQ